MNKKVLHTLEFDKIINKLASFAASKMGKELAEELNPSNDIEQIKLWQKETSEAVSMIMKKGSLALGSLRDIRPFLKRTSVGGVLSIDELLYIGDFLYVSRKAKNYAKSESKNDFFELLQPQFDSIETVDNLEREINRCIISQNEISDDASSALKDIRRSIKSANDKIKEQLNGIIHSQTYKNMLQEPVITIRSDRYCVPVKQEYKGAFSGMIHDQSSTGATVFMEPMSVVNLNNKIKDLHSDEKAEIERILRKLSGLVFENADIFYSNIDILSHLDFVFAKAELSVSMNGTEPLFNTNGYVNIKKARHPLLNPETVVPTDIYIGKEFRTLLITGPNTGGKTVSLKTIGLFTLMGQAGLHISAFDNSELAVFDEVFADIGDEQSIEQSLSTFSSHMSNIVNILNDITDNSLVLTDELGAGTDPTEGAALAIAIIKYLHSRNVRTVVTTHYSELKVFALSTDGVENASCEFDVETLRPTYRLLIGIPGKSNAFAISRRLGLPEYIIEQAKEVLNHEDERFEDVITDLEISKKSLIIEKERAEQYRREAEKLKTDVEAQRKKIREQKEKIILKANEDARKLVSDAKDEADKIVKEMQKMLRESSSHKELDSKRQSLNKKLSDYDNKLNKLTNKQKGYRKVPKKLLKGDKVFIHSLGTSGIVMNPPDTMGMVNVKAGIMKVKVSINDLSMDNSEDVKEVFQKKYSMKVKAGKSQHIVSEVDLRGMMVEEALAKTEKYIDDAYLAGLTPVTIIHGKGTGALRSAIHEFLRKNSHVKNYRLGQYGEGESGVTIVELK